MSLAVTIVPPLMSVFMLPPRSGDRGLGIGDWEYMASSQSLIANSQSLLWGYIIPPGVRHFEPCQRHVMLRRMRLQRLAARQLTATAARLGWLRARRY